MLLRGALERLRAAGSSTCRCGFLTSTSEPAASIRPRDFIPTGAPSDLNPRGPHPERAPLSKGAVARFAPSAAKRAASAHANGSDEPFR
jgi:hypothetical protein